jgi:hypothetical protein
MSEAKKPLNSSKSAVFLHDHPNFLDLLRPVGQARDVNAGISKKLKSS